VNLNTKLNKIQLENPTVLASGILGVTGASVCYAAKNCAGAVTFKSVSLDERQGHDCPVMLPWENGLINAVGLCSQGIDEAIEEVKIAVSNANVPVIASIFASTVKEFGEVAERISEAKPSIIEVNISCPNVQSEFGTPFGTDARISAKVTEAVKNSTKIPVFVKLTPNTPNLKQIAKAVESAGADGITAINTVGPGMVIDIYSGKPILTNKTGGISGPAIKPIAIRCVYDIYGAVKIPIIGTGGVCYGKDAIEMMMAGASAVGIGSGVYYRGIDVFKKVCDEMKEFMEQKGYTKLNQIIGISHE
jgi:dihydroorotate dehydrogenase (NAD+) catalytic subunit